MLKLSVAAKSSIFTTFFNYCIIILYHSIVYSDDTDVVDHCPPRDQTKNSLMKWKKLISYFKNEFLVPVLKGFGT